MIATIVVSVVLIGGLCFGLYTLFDNEPIWSIILFATVAICLSVLMVTTSLFNPNGLYLSLESRQQFEDQIREITSEQIINVKYYDYSNQGTLDVQIGDSYYDVEFRTIDGVATVKSISQDRKILYDLLGIEWENKPNTE